MLCKKLYENVGGVTAAIEALQQLIEIPAKNIEIFNDLNIKPVNGILFHGPSGIGKSLLINAFINETGINCVQTSGPQLVLKTKHDLNYLQDVLFVYDKMSPLIIVIDQIDYIASVDINNNQKDLKDYIVSKLISLMDNLQSHIFVIGVTNKNINNINPILKTFGRFDKEIKLNLPNYDERIEILKVYTKNMKISLIDLQIISKKTDGFTGAQLAKLCRDATLLCVTESFKQSNNLKEIVIDYSCFDKVMNNRPKHEHIYIPKVKLEDIVGLSVDYAKNQLIKTIKYPNIYSKYNFDSIGSVSHGYLLWGPPGCGKKSLVKAIANHFGRHLVMLNCVKLLAIQPSESEIREHIGTVMNKFAEAKRLSPSILLLDNIDFICNDKMISQILAEIDDIDSYEQVFIIGSTNRPDIVHPSITKPGRVDKLIFIDLPDFPSRVSILQTMSRKLPMDVSVDFQAISESTHGYNAIDLKSLLKTAAKLAMKNIISIEAQKSRLLLVYGYVRKMENITENMMSNDVYLLIRKYYETEELENIEEQEQMPIITMKMLRIALKESHSSVSPAEYQKYLSMKIQFDRQYGIENDVSTTVEQNANNNVHTTSYSVAVPSLVSDDTDDTDIYD